MATINAYPLYIYMFLSYKFIGVAIGSGWQAYVAYINLGCYYLIGLPLGILMGWVFHLGVMVCIFVNKIFYYAKSLIFFLFIFWTDIFV